jgi:hypothetical protein
VSQAPVKVADTTKERIRYMAALCDMSQAQLVDKAVAEYAARHADELHNGIERAREVLAGGDAAIASYLIGEPLESVERVAGTSKSRASGEIDAPPQTG